MSYWITIIPCGFLLQLSSCAKHQFEDGFLSPVGSALFCLHLQSPDSVVNSPCLETQNINLATFLV
ncbi:hypothetical protein M758_N006600 [Ceratodon purpureus]|nr:hypothetical protein M758_N006600 [Ceratodon purpureus]